MRISVAFRAFWSALFSKERCDQIAQTLARVNADEKPASRSIEVQPVKKAISEDPKKTATQGRSDALTLLSTLQREARLLDLIQEPLDSYSDAQVGAAARDVLRDSQKTLHRLLQIEPLLPNAEGDSVEIPQDASALRYKLVGASQGSQGVIVHSGWQARICEIPRWSGPSADALVISPAEIEILK